MEVLTAGIDDFSKYFVDEWQERRQGFNLQFHVLGNARENGENPSHPKIVQDSCVVILLVNPHAMERETQISPLGQTVK